MSGQQPLRYPPSPVYRPTPPSQELQRRMAAQEADARQRQEEARRKDDDKKTKDALAKAESERKAKAEADRAKIKNEWDSFIKNKKKK